MPVIEDGGRVVGIVTERDACMAEAEGLLAEKKVRRLPVVDATGRLMRLLSLNDIAREAARQRGEKRNAISDAEVGETVAAICEARAAAKPGMVSEPPSKALSAA